MTTYFPGILSNGALVPGLAAGTVRTTLGLGTADSPTFAGVTAAGGDFEIQSTALMQISRVTLQGGSTASLIKGGFNHGSHVAIRDGIHVLTSGSFTRIMMDTAGNLRMRDTGGVHWYNGTSVFNVNQADLSLYRGGPGILSQRNATNAQISEVYKTYTSATSNERLAFDTTAAGFYDIVAGRGSAGGAERGIRIGSKLDGGSFVPWVSFATTGAATFASTIVLSPVASNILFRNANTFIGELSNSGKLVFSGGGGNPSLRTFVDASGRIGIGTSAPTAYIQLPASTTAANTAPIKLATGVLMTTPQAGAIEYDGTNLYFTDSGGTRRTLAVV